MVMVEKQSGDGRESGRTVKQKKVIIMLDNVIEVEMI